MLFSLAANVAEASPPVADRYDCAGCKALLHAGVEHCVQLGACRLLDAARTDCRAVCNEPVVEEEVDDATKPPKVPFQLRVSKGLGSKPYGTLRVSSIGSSDDAPEPGFDYSAPFQHRWKQFRLSSSLVEVPTPGTPYRHSFGPGRNVSLWLPAQGAGVAGVLIADPCVRFASITSLVACKYAQAFKTYERTMPLLNAFVGHDDTDFWGILGDNFSDQGGRMTEHLYSRLELPALSNRKDKPYEPIGQLVEQHTVGWNATSPA